MVVMEPTPVDTVLATAMGAMAKGLLILRLMPTMAMEAMVDTVLATPLATVLVTAMGAMAKGLLILRLMPTTAMVDTVELTPDMVMVDTDLVLATATATASKH